MLFDAEWFVFLLQFYLKQAVRLKKNYPDSLKFVICYSENNCITLLASTLTCEKIFSKTPNMFSRNYI